MHRLFLPGCSFDMNVTIAVGILRWALCLQREEIRILLKGRGIKISTGEISYLSERFLAYFCILHRSRYPEIARLFESMGGAVLHIDGTEEKGSEVVFCAKEGRTGITVMADTLPVESEEHVTKFLKRYKKEFGSPLVVVRDMSQTLEKCVAEVFPGVPQQICHFHFVKNLGKDVLQSPYFDLRRKVIGAKMVPRLTELKKTLRCEGRKPIETAELFWIRLAIEHLEYARDHSSGFPFKLGYYELLERAEEVHRLARRIMVVNSGQHNIFVEELMTMDAHIKRSLDDEGVKADARRLGFLAAWFEKVREALRLSRPKNPLEGGEPIGSEELRFVERRLDKALKGIDEEARLLDGDYPKIASKIRKKVAEHRHELFVHVKDNTGRDVVFSRDNNFLERSHRWGRMRCRRRTGRSMTRREMDTYGALNAIFSNLFNELYVKEILGDVDDLGMVFQQLDYGEVRGFLKELYRARRKQFFPVRDSDRGLLLERLVESLECGDISHVRIDEWLVAFS